MKTCILILSLFLSFLSFGQTGAGLAIESYFMDQKNSDTFIIGNNLLTLGHKIKKSGGEFIDNGYLGVDVNYLLSNRLILGIKLKENSSTYQPNFDDEVNQSRIEFGGRLGYTLYKKEEDQEFLIIACDLNFSQGTRERRSRLKGSNEKIFQGLEYGLTIEGAKRFLSPFKNQIRHSHYGKVFLKGSAQYQLTKTGESIHPRYSIGVSAYPIGIKKHHAIGIHAGTSSENIYDYTFNFTEVGAKGSAFEGLVDLSLGVKFYNIEDQIQEETFSGKCLNTGLTINISLLNDLLSEIIKF